MMLRHGSQFVSKKFEGGCQRKVQERDSKENVKNMVASFSPFSLSHCVRDIKLIHVIKMSELVMYMAVSG